MEALFPTLKFDGSIADRATGLVIHKKQFRHVPRGAGGPSRGRFCSAGHNFGRGCASLRIGVRRGGACFAVTEGDARFNVPPRITATSPPTGTGASFAIVNTELVLAVAALPA